MLGRCNFILQISRDDRQDAIVVRCVVYESKRIIKLTKVCFRTNAGCTFVCFWSFIASLLSFMWSAALRIPITFDLFKKEKMKPSLVMFLSTTSLSCHLINTINDNLQGCHPNIGAMTVALVRKCIQRSFAGNNKFEIMSFVTAVASIVLSVIGVEECKNRSYDAEKKEKQQW